MATTEEQQTKQSVPDTQLPPLRPPHDTSTPADTITLQNVPNNSCQNINPLTAEDLKKVLNQTTLQAQLYTNLVLVSVEELQKAIADITRDKVNLEEPPSHIPTTISGQPLEQIAVDTSTKVDSTIQVLMIEHKIQSIEEKEPTQEQTRKIDTSCLYSTRTRCTSTNHCD